MTQFDQRYQQVETQYNAEQITIQPTPLSLTEKQQKQNHTRMLQRVQAIWIDGVLEPSLQGAAQIALELQKKPSAIVTPLWHVLREFDTTGQLTSENASIEQVYDHANGEALILGEPGSGKTTLLLELTRTLLERAGQDEAHPIPVVFPLSSWATKRQPLTTWLASELHSRYQVPLPLATSWIETDQVLPLLDGLDEVAATHRAACVEAINSYRQAHGLIPTVVCSRQTDYLALSTHLLLRTAVVVQPLTPEQIESYLTNGGERLEALRQILHKDAELRTFANTPLMLNVLTATYQGTTSQEIIATGSLGKKQDQIFASYVQRMLIRRTPNKSITSVQTIHWLSWLARQMKQQNQSIFYIEHLQPDWLTGERMHRVYDRWALRFPAVLMGILVSLSISLLLAPTDLSNLAFSLAPIIVLGGFIGWLLGTGSTIQQPHENSRKARRGSWSRLVERLKVGVFVGLTFGLTFGLIGGLSAGLASGLSYGLASGLTFGLTFGMSGMLLQSVLEKSNKAASSFQVPHTSRKPRWQNLMKHVGIRNGILVGLSIGLSTALSIWLSTALSTALGTALTLGLYFVMIGGLLGGMLYGLLAGLCGGLLSVLLIGKPVGITLTDELVWSWRSLGRSLFEKRHLSITLSVMVFIGLLVGLGNGLSIELSAGLASGLSYGLTFGLSFWLLLGLFQGVSSETIGDQHRVEPNQGIRRSARNSIILGLISTGITVLSAGLASGLASGTSYGLNFDLSADLRYGLSVGLIIGLSVGLLAGLLYGGLACLRHGVIRFLLCRAGSISWNYPRFLEYATEHLLLRKVGGGYIFLHQLLLVYFANLGTGTDSDEAVEDKQESLPPDTMPSASVEPTGVNEPPGPTENTAHFHSNSP